MINEISNFVDTIPQEYHTEGLSPSPGLHILIDLDENGNLKENGWKSYIFDKKGKCYDYTEDGKLTELTDNNQIAQRWYYSQIITINKAVDSKKKIHTSIPYSLSFKNTSIDQLNTLFASYFSNCKQYILEEEFNTIKKIENYCSNNLVEKLLNENKLKDVDSKNDIYVYFNTSIEKMKLCQENYLSANLFNKDDFNIEDMDERDIWGLSDFLNGANSKKIFMMHKTSLIQDGVNNRISKNKKIPLKLYKFETLLKNKKLPRTVPIFIDKDELNREFIKIYNRDRNQTFREILRQLFEQNAEDISNYYLINWANRMGIVIDDIDYVSKFRFNLENFIIYNLFKIPNMQEKEQIKNIFDFEISVVQKIFNNSLIVKTSKDSILFKYFDDIDPKYTTQTNYQNILKYRKDFYDFVYKSKENAIDGNIFYDLLMSIIIDDIKHDEYKDNRHSKDFAIKEKLNILFSLNHNFDKENKNFKYLGDKNMASIIPEFQNSIRRLFKEVDYHIQTDSEFVFAAGQLIYYILTKSQQSNKTHALLEPFISKNDPQLFKLIISRGIDQYKHAFDFGSSRFEKLSSEILGYDCKTNIKELLPILLAGYFSQSIIFEKSNNQ